MGHLGISKCRTRAKTTVFWANIDHDISQLITRCDICHEHQYAPPSYDKHSVEAHFPSHIYGADLCDIDWKVHVVCVDYFSFFIWECPLPDMQSDTVILGLKTIFSESGLPEILIIGNGRSFISKDFKLFAMEWPFVHKTSSPRYPKGNAHAEWAVGIVKEVYIKCKDDFLLGLLVHRTTLLLYMKSKLSLAELFFSHRLASNLPIIHSSNPELVAERQPKDEPSRTREVNFEPGDNVWVCLSPKENTWKQGIVIHNVVGVPDSFVVEINGQQYRRNKHDITFSLPKGDNGVVGVPLVVNMPRNKLELRTKLID